MNNPTTRELTEQERAEFIKLLVSNTVTALKSAQNDTAALKRAVEAYFAKATGANLTLEEIEDVLGVNDPSIMDLAGLSVEDEEIVIDTFEQISNG